MESVMPTKEWREKNQDKMKAYRRKWYEENKIVVEVKSFNGSEISVKDNEHNSTK